MLHVSQPVDAGVARCVADLVTDQVERGWRVAVACPRDGGLANEARERGAVHVDWCAEREPGLAVARETREIARVIGSLRPDLVHLHSSKAGLAGRLALRGRRPTVFQPNAWSFEAGTELVRAAALRWERLAARWTDVVVCVSDAERVRGESAGIRARWRVVPNGVDVSVFETASADDRAEARHRLGLGERPLVVCIGRLSRQKGQDVLLDAWPSVVERVPAAELVLVGNGPDEASLATRAANGVRFVGRRDDVADWLAAADVVTLPSRWEGLSFVMLEAMARARSVVATDVAGAREALDGSAGAVVPIEAPAPLAHALVERLLDPGKATAEGREGRRRIETSYDVRRTTALMAAVYAEVLAARSA